MTKVGEHVTLDIIGTTQEYDPSLFESVIYKIAKAAKVTVLEISKYKFEPIIGEIYHLYEDSNGNRTLSLIGPTEWNKKHLYSVIFNSDMTWTKLPE